MSGGRSASEKSQVFPGNPLIIPFLISGREEVIVGFRSVVRQIWSDERRDIGMFWREAQRNTYVKGLQHMSDNQTE